MKYLVTGADGFLGRHFLAALAARGIATRAMLIPGASGEALPGRPEVVHADLLNAPTLAPAVEGISHVIHLAARVHMMNDPAPDPRKAFFEVNVGGTQLLLEAAARSGAKRFLLMSTVKAMGEEQAGHFDENSQPQPSTPYGCSKLAAEQMVFEMARGHEVQAVALRLPMVYGPGAKGNVLRLLEAAAAGKRLPFGRVSNRRSMVYVGNVVDAALCAVDRAAAAGKVFLVCDERPYGTAELYAAICRSMGKAPLLRNVPVWLLRAAGCIGDVVGMFAPGKMPIDSDVVKRIAGDLCFDGSRITRELGWTPRVALEEGIERTVQWYRQGCPPTP